jgi:glucosamine-6-phosphate deaminase
MGAAAADSAAEVIRQAVQERGSANLILATGNSQLSFIEALRQADLPWQEIRIFHLDQFVGINPDHPASFSRYLNDKLVKHAQPGDFFPIPGDEDKLTKTVADYEKLLKEFPPDFVALGIGENGHLAFNDPPYAQFDDPMPVRVVRLAEQSRMQQVGEGHFNTIEDVPEQAITLTIPTILSGKAVFAMVPELRKADVVRKCLTQPISEALPGTVLRIFRNARLFLDRDSASRLVRNLG